MIDPAAIEQAWQGPWQMMTRKMRRFLVALAAGLGIFFWLWVPLLLLGAAVDDAYRRETLGRALLFVGLGLVGVVVGVFLHRRFDPEHRAQDALKRDGAKVAGQLLRRRYVPTGGQHIPVNMYYLFGAEVPGGPPVFARLTARAGLPVGTPATIAYDPARPDAGVVVETAGQLRARARSAPARSAGSPP